MECAAYLYLIEMEQGAGSRVKGAGSRDQGAIRREQGAGANRKWCASTGTPLPIGSATSLFQLD